MSDARLKQFESPDLNQLFGTDGIRGQVGVFPVTTEFSLLFGQVLGEEVLHQGGSSVVLGIDTRHSSPQLADALQTGINLSGVDVYRLGIIPTPGVAVVTQDLQAHLGIVISASHNPAQDNGFKLFDRNGRKVAIAIENRLVQRLKHSDDRNEVDHLGRSINVAEALGIYRKYCQSFGGSSFQSSSIRVVLDCANGACFRVAPRIIRELGLQVETIGCEPNGYNIHDQCGSTTTDWLANEVVARNADIGFAFDGDGDRVICVGDDGRVYDGDYILYALAKARRLLGETDFGVVSTVMANLGLERSLNRLAIPFERVDVGDRNVCNRLRELSWSLGGESSGHILSRPGMSTGDGIITALDVLRICQQLNMSFAEIVADMERLPGVLTNVSVANATRIANDPRVGQLVSEIQQIHDSSVRVLVRASGTEPVVRIFVEGIHQETVEAESAKLEQLIRELNTEVC